MEELIEKIKEIANKKLYPFADMDDADRLQEILNEIEEYEREAK